MVVPELKRGDFGLHHCSEGTAYMFIQNHNPYEVIERILELEVLANKWNGLDGYLKECCTPKEISEAWWRLSAHSDGGAMKLMEAEKVHARWLQRIEWCKAQCAKQDITPDQRSNFEWLLQHLTTLQNDDFIKEFENAKK